MSGLISPAAKAARKVAAAALESPASAYGVVDAIVFGLDAAQLLQSPETAAELDRLRGERNQFADRVDTLTAVAKSNKRHVQQLFGDLQTALARVTQLETAAALVSEYRVPCDEVGSIWLWVRREPGGDRWAILTSHRIEGERRAWVGGRWQALPVVGESGLFEFDTAEDALCQALVLAEGGERP